MVLPQSVVTVFERSNPRAGRCAAMARAALQINLGGAQASPRRLIARCAHEAGWPWGVRAQSRRNHRCVCNHRGSEATQAQSGNNRSGNANGRMACNRAQLSSGAIGAQSGCTWRHSVAISVQSGAARWSEVSLAPTLLRAACWLPGSWLLP